MSEEQKRILQQQLWKICCSLWGKVPPDDYRDYILGFIFYKFLSEQMERMGDEALESDEIKYADLDESDSDSEAYLEAVRSYSIDSLGYFLKPSQLFKSIIARMAADPDLIILPMLEDIFKDIENSTKGEASEADFKNLFEDIELNSSKLGKTVEGRNQLIRGVLDGLAKIDFRLDEIDADVLGDAYEYLISNFASDAGKKAGEFYTPREASQILSRAATLGKTSVRSAYDPTCGSGSLLIGTKRYANVGKFYGQESNRTTYNLARMNMILHGIHFKDFNVQRDDTLENPHHLGQKFEVIVANPPFSMEWKADKTKETDDRFAEYGKLAPKTKADMAFIQHMLYHLDDNGTACVIVPHGVLFRGSSEGHIREHMIREMNCLDAVIGLPANLFFGTGIPAAILVFKKCREDSENVLFIDASQHFQPGKNQNKLRQEDVDRIINTLESRATVEKYSYLAPLSEIAENEYNLNIPRYVDTFEEEEEIDLMKVNTERVEIEKEIAELNAKMNGYLKELGYV